METFLKFLGILIIILFLVFFWNKLFNKEKKNFDSIEEFIEAIYSNPNNDFDKNFIYSMRCIEFCENCEQEKKSKNSPEIEHLKNNINEHIFVEFFRSDNDSWRHLCGREGYVFKCRKHNINVYEHITCMN